MGDTERDDMSRSSWIDCKVPFIDAKSGVQKKVDALEARVAELTELVKKLQKGGSDLSARAELGLEEDSDDTAADDD